MADLTTHYMNLKLKNPIVAAASPLSKTLDGIKKLEDAGAGAIVLYSLFEEQLQSESDELDYFLTAGTDSNAEATSFFPSHDEYNLGSEEYLDHIRQARKAAEIPIIASLNGVSKSGWTSFAKDMESAGASGLELNVYYIPTSPDISSADIEKRYIDVVKAVKSTISIPVAVKLSPFFSSLSNMGANLTKAGADALVLFNRYYQPDIDLNELTVEPRNVLSSPQDKFLPMRWIAILSHHLSLDLAASTGIHSSDDLIKMLMAGAKVGQVASVLLEKKADWVTKTLESLNAWLDKREYKSVNEIVGLMSYNRITGDSIFERANYVKTLTNYSNY